MHPVRWASILVVLALVAIWPESLKSQEEEVDLFLPLIQVIRQPQAPVVQDRPLLHVPLLENGEELGQAAVFWFGDLAADTNYTDVRVGYTGQELIVYLAIFDRRLWYDVTPTKETLTEWDAATLLVALEDSNAQVVRRWKVVAQMSFDDSTAKSVATAEWINGRWVAVAFPLQAVSGWRGERLNDDVDARGWAQTFRIPFGSMMNTEPEEGTSFRLGLIVHDRDGLNVAANPVQQWPKGLEIGEPNTWGRVILGSPKWQRPALKPSGTLLLRREHQSDHAVPDADVGGTTSNLCGGASASFWADWPNANYGDSPDFNVQNQIDVADWPCYSKYFVTFPITDLAANMVVITATLSLHQFGNSGTVDLAKPTWIQASRVDSEWSEETITWNNAPHVLENMAGRWVTPVPKTPDWPGIRWEWDVSKAVADAQRLGEPVRLALYSADSNYHGGKFFVTSDAGDWNEEGRPTLTVVWGRP
jgi:hypothetical protein